MQFAARKRKIGELDVKSDSKEAQLDALARASDNGVRSVRAANDPVLNACCDTVDLMKNIVAASGLVGFTQALHQLDPVALKKLVEVVYGNNKVHKLATFKQYLFAQNLAAIRAKQAVMVDLDDAMESSVNLAICAAFGDERGQISWNTVGSTIQEVIALKERATGAGAAAAGRG